MSGCRMSEVAESPVAESRRLQKVSVAESRGGCRKSGLQNVWVANCLSGKLSEWRNVGVAKCLGGKMSELQNVSVAGSLVANCRVADCLVAICL